MGIFNQPKNPMEGMMCKATGTNTWRSSMARYETERQLLDCRIKGII
jgi:hypothetical protein